VIAIADTNSDSGGSPIAREPWLRRPAASDRFFAGDQRVSTAAGSPASTESPPEARELTASAIRDFAERMVVPLFVGRADPGLATPTVDVPAVAGR
jgi:hypothetical protein